MTKVLEIDAGNSFVKWRLSDREVIEDRGKIATSQFEAQSFTSNITQGLEVIRLASVSSGKIAEEVNQIAIESRARLFIASTQKKQAGVICGYENPSLLGVDRWLAMLAAYNRYKKNCLIASFGTAATVDLVNSSGQHLGGYIVPGLTLMRQSLLSGTHGVDARMLRGSTIQPGRNTNEAVGHGALLLLKSLIEVPFKEMAEREAEPQVVMTGGDAERVKEVLDLKVEYWPDLVLDGLSLADRKSGDST